MATRSNPSPQVFEKIAVSRLPSRGSLSTADKLTDAMYTVHLNWSCTTDGSLFPKMMAELLELLRLCL